MYKQYLCRKCKNCGGRVVYNGVNYICDYCGTVEENEKSHDEYVETNSKMLSEQPKEENIKYTKRRIRRFTEDLKRILYYDYIVPNKITNEKTLFKCIDELLKLYEVEE